MTYVYIIRKNIIILKTCKNQHMKHSVRKRRSGRDKQVDVLRANLMQMTRREEAFVKRAQFAEFVMEGDGEDTPREGVSLGEQVFF